jgi:hypothetical protein
LSQLTKAGVYWIPSIDTFPVISAAVVHKRTLHAFLYTIRDTHEFNETTFREFLDSAFNNLKTSGISSVLVHFISPEAFEVWKGPGKDSSLDFDFRCKPVTLHFHQLDIKPYRDVSDACQQCFRKCFSLFAPAFFRNIALGIKRLRRHEGVKVECFGGMFAKMLVSLCRPGHSKATISKEIASRPESEGGNALSQ